MTPPTDRRAFLGAAAATAGASLLPGAAVAQQPKGPRGGSYVLPADLAAFNAVSVILGRAGDTDVTASLVARERTEAYLEYGTEPGRYGTKTRTVTLAPNEPVELAVTDLRPGTPYYYRLHTRKAGEGAFAARAEARFHTRRPPGQRFTFCVQGDSHPERPQMSEPTLYARTIRRAAADNPDLYVCMGDDFSVDTVRTVSPETLTAPYLLQRPFLGLVAQSASLYLVNGNHEQASRFNFNQTDERKRVAVGVQTARNRYYPMPAPGGIYTGDAAELEGIGKLRDYFAWTWGDALFVVLDNYWHSPALVDNGFHGGGGKKDDDKKNRDMWAVTIGDEQYRWFKRTLETSTARYKFVFAHHVMGTGRGGVEASELFEWGGGTRGKGPADEFRRRRPGWELPIHQLMARHKVSAFFQGHDHLYCRQERDGVVYQEVPLPADHGYSTYNAEAYTSGTKLANAGYLRVTVGPDEATVEYVRCFLPKDETATRKTGDVAHAYTIRPRP